LTTEVIAIATVTVTSLLILTLQVVAALLLLVRWKVMTGAGAAGAMKEAMLLLLWAREALGSTMMWRLRLMPVLSWARERLTGSISAEWG
jgi:hypothetical protein